MKTKIFMMKEDNIDYGKIDEAACAIREGGLVVFPTETVYGLGANALDALSVKKIYKAKGRPSDNPLIVHIKSRDDLPSLVTKIPKGANKLMEKFWPGPLTLIFKKSDAIPKETSGGLDTIAIRFPSNKIAQAIIERAGVPIAAPSANTSGKVSGTTLKMCIDDLNGKVDYIIGEDDSKSGLESTIVDCTVSPYLILRPGIITLEDIRAVINDVYLDKSILLNDKVVKPKAPGMKYKHYSPKAEIRIISGDRDKAVEYICRKASELILENKKIGIMCIDETYDLYRKFPYVVSLGKLKDELKIASNLFKTLHYFDMQEVDIILSESFDETNIGLAIMNRLKKSSGYNIINLR